MIVPSTSVEHPFKLNTSRLGIDSQHNGQWICAKDYIEVVPLSQLVPITQDLSAVVVNPFFKLNDGQLAYVTAINADGLCMCTEAKGEHLNTVWLPYEFVSNSIMFHYLNQLDDRA